MLLHRLTRPPSLAGLRLLLTLLASFSWQELRQHPWRNGTAVLAIALGVALAFAVHLINASALDEFSQGVRALGGQPDLELRARHGGTEAISLDWYARLAHDPEVALASPLLELGTNALPADARPDSPRVAVRVLGVDALTVARIAPDLLPQPGAGQDRLVVFHPDAVFLNASAAARLGEGTLRLQSGLQWRPVRVAGRVAAAGSPLIVMDIAAAQDLFDKPGHLSRVDLRLKAGAARAAWLQRWTSQADWPAHLAFSEPGVTAQRGQAVSRAYRVNLSVLALVALFTGAFLVFSVVALSVSRRSRQFALLGVLGLTGAQRGSLVILESAVLGLVGTLLGLALGSALAALGLRLLGGDLGGGFFASTSPRLQWSLGAALLYGLAGVAAAVVGAWWPARWSAALPAAQALKSTVGMQAQAHSARTALGLLAAAGLLSLAPPVQGIPVAAYCSVGLLLVGGIVGLPWLVALVLDRIAPHLTGRPLATLAVERARRMRETAAIAVSGVVAALSLSVALTVMVASFRDSVGVWLDTMLPADLYVRTAAASNALDTATFDPGFIAAVRQLPGVQQVATVRAQAWLADPAMPPVTVLAREVAPAATNLPLLAAALPVPAGAVAVYVSEALRDLHGARTGTRLVQLERHFQSRAAPGTVVPPLVVAGVWRDYARQFGTVVLHWDDFIRLTGDTRANELSLWLERGTSVALAEQRLRALAQARAGADAAELADRVLEFGSAQEIRAVSLRIFDRSFAVTYWLQALAIGIGLFGIAASFGSQVLARRKEFGLLVHLGLTRRDILKVLTLEGLAWTTLGALAGTVLGLAIALVLVHIVNPQSFHWSMDLSIPALRLALLAGAVIAAGTLTAAFTGRSAASHHAVAAVREDW